MIGIYLILVYGVGLALLGFLTLRFVPGFRLSVVNFIVFEIGAILGMFATANLVVLGLRHLLRYLSIRTVRDSDPLTYALYLMVFLGSIAGGAASVRLKMYLARIRERNPAR